MYFPSCGMQIGLDNGQGDLSFISHAHSDHLSGANKNKRLIASEETLALAELKVKSELPQNVKLLDSGHILGAKQLFVEEDGKCMVYTGDLRTKDSLLFKGAEVNECDSAILDATYADPFYNFPPYFEVYDEIARWVKKNQNSNLIIGCYDLGKSQEIIRILNEYLGITPIVNEKTGRFSAVYEKFGVKLNRIAVGSEEAKIEMRKGFVALVSMRHAKRYFARRLADAFERETLCAVATGWSLRYRYDVDKAFPLSDHADFQDIKRYIEQTGAKEVEFHSGDGTAILKACGLGKMANTLLGI